MIVLVNRDEHVAQCTILWEGGAHSTFTHRLNRTGRHSRCTDEEIVGLVRKLANHYPDEMIARILNRQHLKTGQGNSFTAGRICSLRHHYGISKYTGSSPDTESRFYNVEEAAEELKVSKATLLRWLREGFIQGVQFTPGAPWQIDITEELRAKIVPTVPDGWMPLNEAASVLGCTKQTVLNRMRSGKLDAIYVCQGKRQGYRFFVGHDKTEPDLFDLQEHGEGGIAKN
jgi:excisionase family DNA binding protein